eukprot:PhM_4_TR19090/c0_g1_i1/m.43902
MDQQQQPSTSTQRGNDYLIPGATDDDVGSAVDNRSATARSKGRSSGPSSFSYLNTSTLSSVHSRRSAVGRAILFVLAKLNIPLGAISVVAVGAPIVGLVIFATFFVLDKVDEVKENHFVAVNTPFLEPLLELTHELQLEREETVWLRLVACSSGGGTAGADNITQIQNKLLSLQERVDLELREYTVAAALPSSEVRDSAAVKKSLDIASTLPVQREQLAKLGQDRTKCATADAQQQDVDSIVTVYKEYVERLLAVPSVVARHTSGEASQLARDISVLSLVKEDRSLASTFGIAAAHSQRKEFYERVEELTDAANYLEESYITLSPPARQDEYRAALIDTPENVLLSEAVRSASITNITWWFNVTLYRQTLMVGIEGSLLHELEVHTSTAEEDGLVAERIAIGSLVAAVVLSLAVALLQWYVTMASNANQQEEINLRSQMEAVFLKLIPVAHLEALQCDVRSLTTRERATSMWTLILVKVWNLEELVASFAANSHSADKMLYDVMADFAATVFRTAESRDALVEKLQLDHVLIMVEDTTTALVLALELQAAISHLNALRAAAARDHVDLGVGISVHSGACSVGFGGTKTRFEGIVASSTVATIARIAKYAHSIRAALVVSDVVLHDMNAKIPLRTRSIGHVRPCTKHNNNAMMMRLELLEVLNLDDAETYEEKVRLGAIVSRVVDTVAPPPPPPPMLVTTMTNNSNSSTNNGSEKEREDTDAVAPLDASAGVVVDADDERVQRAIDVEVQAEVQRHSVALHARVQKEMRARLRSATQ